MPLNQQQIPHPAVPTQSPSLATLPLAELLKFQTKIQQCPPTVETQILLKKVQELIHTAQQKNVQGASTLNGPSWNTNVSKPHNSIDVFPVRQQMSNAHITPPPSSTSLPPNAARSPWTFSPPGSGPYGTVT